MGIERLSPRIQTPANCPYPDPGQFSPCNKVNNVHPDGVWFKILFEPQANSRIVPLNRPKSAGLLHERILHL
jgi:hypothetical protein